MKKFEDKCQKYRLKLSQAEAASQETQDDDTELRDRLFQLGKEADSAAARKRELEQQFKQVSGPFKALERQLQLLQKEERNLRCLKL